MEHSGTTLLSQLLNAHPRVAAGFECGLLLDRPERFHKIQPFWDWLIGTHGGWGWGLLPEDRERILHARSHEEAYDILCRFKGKAHGGELEKLFQAADLIYDKTPRYVYFLPEIVQKVSAPVIITVKWPADALASARKRKFNMLRFATSYVRTIRKISKTRALIVSYSDLAENIDGTMARVAKYVGLQGDLSLAAYRRRFGHLITPSNSFHTDRVSYHPAEADVLSDFISGILFRELRQLKVRSKSASDEPSLS